MRTKSDPQRSAMGNAEARIISSASRKLGDQCSLAPRSVDPQSVVSISSDVEMDEPADFSGGRDRVSGIRASKRHGSFHQLTRSQLVKLQRVRRAPDTIEGGVTSAFKKEKP